MGVRCSDALTLTSILSLKGEDALDGLAILLAQHLRRGVDGL